MLGHLLDAFLLSAVPVATESERRRNSNPRKLYPADPGLIRAYDSSGRSNLGHALETAVLNELDRRRAEVTYVKTQQGFAVDFHARYRGGGDDLVQVCADPSTPGTMERELRALAAAGLEFPGATQRVLVLTRDQVLRFPASGVRTQPAHEWLLARPD